MVTFSFSIVTKRPFAKSKSERTEINCSSAGQSSCNILAETTSPKNRLASRYFSASARMSVALEKFQLASSVTNRRFPERSPRTRSASCWDHVPSAVLW